MCLTFAQYCSQCKLLNTGDNDDIAFSPTETDSDTSSETSYDSDDSDWQPGAAEQVAASQDFDT